MTNTSALSEYIGLILEQDSTRLKKDLMNVTMKLTMTKDSHVPDTLTRIRVLPSVAVVGQDNPVDRSGGTTKLEVYVKFLPTAESTHDSLQTVGKLIKALPGVKMIKIISVGGRVVLWKGSPIVL
jgi:hypothetical protein